MKVLEFALNVFTRIIDLTLLFGGVVLCLVIYLSLTGGIK